MILLNKNSPKELVDKVIKMDKIANNIYKKTGHVLQDRAEYLTYIRAEQAELDKKAQMKYREEKGKEEKEVEIAINLKNKGISLEIIAETTGMSISRIKKL